MGGMEELLDLQRRFGEYQRAFQDYVRSTTSMSESEIRATFVWPEIIYEDILDAEEIS